MNTGATFNGRALAQSAVTLDANTVSLPALTVTPTPTPTVAAPSGSSGGDNSGGSDDSSSPSSGGSSGGSSGAGIVSSSQLAPVQVPALAVNNPSVAAPATGATGQLAPTQTPVATTTQATAAGGLSLMGIAGIVALVAIFGVALLIFIRKEPVKRATPLHTPLFFFEILWNCHTFAFNPEHYDALPGCHAEMPD